MAKAKPRAGELTTTNYGFVKPTVGASDDAWGGYINSDLDGIDSTVKSVSDAIPLASSTTPAMDGTAAVGTGTTWARADHVHPTDARIIGDNRIINGDMRIDQRGIASGVGGTANGYTVDRWAFWSSPASEFFWQRIALADVSGGFPYALKFSAGSSYTVAATDYFGLSQPVEAEMVTDFAWGTSSAKPVTLSFTAIASLSGTFSGTIRNGDNTRSYAFTFPLTASVWSTISVTIPGDTGGTWALSGSGIGVQVGFSLGAGSSLVCPAGAWTSGNYIGASGSINVVATVNAFFSITGVKLEIGSVATPFNRQSLAKSLADCQRYYQALNGMLASGYASAGSTIFTPLSLPVFMRSQPTVVYTGTAYGNASGLVLNSATASMVVNQLVVTGVGTGYVTGTASMSAEL